MESVETRPLSQLTWGSSPYAKRAKRFLQEPLFDDNGIPILDDKGEQVMVLKSEIRPKDLAKLMKISRLKASYILEEIPEYEKRVLRDGCCKYVRVT